MELSNLLMNLASASPLLIVDLLAVILGIVHLGRHKTPALLTLLGGLINLLVMAGWHVGFYLLMSSDRLEDHEKKVELLGVLGFAFSVVHAVAWAMIVFAVFAGRKRAARADPDDGRDDRSRRDRDGREPLQRASRLPD